MKTLRSDPFRTLIQAFLGLLVLLQCSGDAQGQVVTNFTVSNRTTTSLTLTWDSNIININTQWNNGSVTVDNSRTYTFANLTPGGKYTFQIDGNQPFSAFTLPDVVMNLNVTDIKTTSVFLNWTPGTGNSTLYTVKWINNSSNVTNPSFTVTNLIAGGNYTFSVFALAADGTQGASASISAVTYPNVVTNLKVTSKNISALTINWTQPDGNWSNFNVQWNNGSGNITDTGYTITGLTAGRNYTINVSAIAPLERVGAATSVTTSITPAVVNNINIYNRTTSSITIEWNKPDGGWSFFNINFNGSVYKTVSSSYTITGLIPGASYTFQVTAVAEDGITTGAAVSISACTNPVAVTNLIVSNITTSSVFLTWNSLNGNCTNFVINWNNFTLPANSSSASITGLTPGGYYTFIVTAVNENGTANATATVSALMNPDVVQNLRVTGRTTSSVSLTWNMPSGNWSFFSVSWEGGNESNITNTSFRVSNLAAGQMYTFTVTAYSTAMTNKTAGAKASVNASTSPDSVTDLKVFEKNTTSLSLHWTASGVNHTFKVSWTNDSNINTDNTSYTSYTITGLFPGSNYTVNVCAVSSDGSPGESNETSAFTYPEVVTNLEIFNITTKSVSLTWTEPIGNWVRFEIKWTNANMGTSLEYTSELSNTINNLTPGNKYTFTVSALAADNSSGAPTQISNFTYPDVVSNLTIINKTTSSLSLNWNKPNGNWSKFGIELSNGSSVITTEFTYTSSNLTPGSNHTFNVFAIAEDGTKGASTPTSAFTKPDTVKNLTAFSNSTSSVCLNWTEPDGNVHIYNLTWNDSQRTISKPGTCVNDLLSGTNYSFGVFAIAGDYETKGNPVSRSVCTDASPVSNYSCTGSNHQPVLNVTWKTPGNNTGFNISLQNSVNRVENLQCDYCFKKFPDLKYGTNYNVTISTLSCGKSGILEFSCRTGVTYPPVPNNTNEIIQTSQRNETTALIKFSSSLLNDTSGPILAYGILLSTVPKGNASVGLIQNYADFNNKNTNIYLTVLINNTKPTTKNDDISIILGSSNVAGVVSGTTYENGPLNAQQMYYYALVIFTQFQLKDKIVNIEQSVYIVTSYIEIQPFSTPVSPTPIILGVLFAIVILIAVAVGLFVWKRRRSTKNYEDIAVENIANKVSIPVRIEDFERYFKKQQSDSNCGFAEEYEDLKVVGTAQSKTSALFPENKGKNRYNNVLPYDSSRVKLSIHGSPFDDYINANYIPGHNSRKEYIAAQGPLPSTVNEFWRMIWEKNTHTIVMLTKCNEQGRVKCEQYWPSETRLYNNLSVTTTSQIELEDWTIRDFAIKNVKTAEVREVRQFHFTAWPDHGVPETTEVLINFRHLVRDHMDHYSRHSPTVVHCSAGVGRTGTLIALDHLIFQIERENMVDIFGILHDMRMHRPLMVQTEDQYVFLNQCAFDIIKSRRGTNVDLIYQNAAAFSIYENVS